MKVSHKNILKKISLSLTLCLLPQIYLSSQTNVEKISDYNGASLKNHVDFFLPKTKVEAIFKVRKTINKRGRFANYASRMLALDNAIMKDYDDYTINEVHIRQVSIPDTSRHFAIKVKKGKIWHRVNKDENGIILSINLPMENRQDSLREISNEDEFQLTDTTISFDYSTISSGALNAATEEKMASMVKDQILEIRDSRLYLLSGETDSQYDGQTISDALERLDKIEKSLTELFVGKSLSVEEIVRYEITPDAAINDSVICRFSTSLGLIDADDYAGEPIFIKIACDEYDKQRETTDYSPQKDCIPYNIPIKSEISIYTMDRILANYSVTTPQLRGMGYVPLKVLNSKTSSLRFNQFGYIESIN